jgi:photosystem II stability/assembly factor-like uncharacterized protein
MKHCLFAIALMWSAAAHAQESIFTNVASAFRPGPYTQIRVDPTNPERFAVSTADGAILETRDGGSTASEAQVLHKRVFYPMVLRGLGGGRGAQFGRSFGRQAHRLFVSMLHAGLPTTRWAPWMSMEDPSTEVLDIALSGPGGHGAIASPAGVFISDERMGVWYRALGMPRPKGNVLVGTSVAFDPSNPSILFAGTSDGMWVSFNGGQTFNRHPDKKMAEDQVNQILWDHKDPNNVFLIAGGTVYKSENHGESFEAVLGGETPINALVQAEEGVYVATGKGLQLHGADGAKDLVKEEAVLGVVPLGEGKALFATEHSLYLIDGENKRALMNTTASDPFLKLVGTNELAWALTKYGVFRIGVKEPRSKRRARHGPQMLMTLEEVQRATLRHMGIGDPTKSRLNDRWYAALMPMVIVEVKQALNLNASLTQDGTFPIRYRTAQAQSESLCCGAFNTTEPQALVMAKWDLAKIIAGPYGNVSMPFGLVENGLRDSRTSILNEVNWRYREIRNLCAQLRYPPSDPKIHMLWRMRLEEYVRYIEALSGKQLVALDNLEEADEVQE